MDGTLPQSSQELQAEQELTAGLQKNKQNI